MLNIQLMQNSQDRADSEYVLYVEEWSLLVTNTLTH